MKKHFTIHRKAKAITYTEVNSYFFIDLRKQKYHDVSLNTVTNNMCIRRITHSNNYI